MTIDPDYVASLRQRVLESMQKKKMNGHSSNGADRPINKTTSESDMEDGEIADSPEPSPAPVSTQAPLVPRPDPEQVKQIVSYLHSKGYTFQDLLKQGLSEDYLRRTYLELNLEDSPSVNLTSSPDLRPPWLNPAASTKRPAPDTYLQEPSSKRLGSVRHPSLVIELESDDSAESDTSPAHKVLDVARNERLAKLRKMEDEIAATLALIDKAQNMHNSKRADTPQSDAQVQITQSPRYTDSVTYREQSVKLNTLQLELIENENALATRKKDMEKLKVEQASRDSLLSRSFERERDCLRDVTSIKEQIAAMQTRLETLLKEKANIAADRQAIYQSSELSRVSISSIQVAIADLERRRQLLRPQIKLLEAELASSKVIRTTPKTTPRQVSAKVVDPPSPAKSTSQSESSDDISSLSESSSEASSDESIEQIVEPEASLDEPDERNIEAEHSPKELNEQDLEAETSTVESSEQILEVEDKSADALANSPAQSSAPANFYSSFLARFRSFRFHKVFPVVVTSAYRSPTYFNKLKQDRILCKYETQGGTCGEHTKCPDLHFADIFMTGSTPRLDRKCVPF